MWSKLKYKVIKETLFSCQTRKEKKRKFSLKIVIDDIFVLVQLFQLNKLIKIIYNTAYSYMYIIVLYAYGL